MGGIRSKDIRGEALQNELFRRGLDTTEVSLEVGAAPGYIRDAIRRNRINNYSIAALQRLYHISPETYLDIEIPEAVPEVNQASPVIDYDRLYDVIIRAIRDAIVGYSYEE